MERRGFLKTGTAMGAALATEAAPVGRLLLTTGSSRAMLMSAASRVLPTGSLIVWSGSTKAGGPAAALLVGFALWVLKRRSPQVAELEQDGNWMASKETRPDPFAEVWVATPPNRFAETGAEAKVDVGNGRIQVVNGLNERFSEINKDINALEARALTGKSWTVPLTGRVMPTGEDRARLESTYQAMGATFGTKDGPYARLFSDPTGQSTARVSNGTKDGQEFLTVIPGPAIPR